jgi:hypothetical protein
MVASGAPEQSIMPAGCRAVMAPDWRVTVDRPQRAVALNAMREATCRASSNRKARRRIAPAAAKRQIFGLPLSIPHANVDDRRASDDIADRAA